MVRAASAALLYIWLLALFKQSSDARNVQFAVSQTCVACVHALATSLRLHGRLC